MDKSLLEAARAVALHYIGYAARSRAELEQRLARAQFPGDIIEAVVEECAGRGWIDDAALASAWIADRADRKRYGSTRLAAELRRKGVAPDALSAAIEEIAGEDELRRALDVGRARARASLLARDDPAAAAAEKRRLAGILQRRGFSWSVIEQVFTQLRAEEDPPA